MVERCIREGVGAASPVGRPNRFVAERGRMAWEKATSHGFEAQLLRLPGRAPTAKAIRYALNHRAGLERLLDDGRIEIDSNVVERAIRPVVLSRKNALFASGDDGGMRWAAVASLVETCKLNGVDPQRYFSDVLTRLVNGWPQTGVSKTWGKLLACPGLIGPAEA